MAVNIFAIGPAKETYTISLLGWFKLLKFTGTGFAHPKRNKSNIKVPTGSR